MMADPSPASPLCRTRLACVAVGMALAALASAPASAQEGKPYVPMVGQEGKDVVWVPTPQPVVDRMLDLAKVTPQDRLLDLGSGDGRTVITAARRGLRAQGIEYNPKMVELARRNAQEAGVADRATFITGDLFKANLTDATVITMFLLPSINEQLRPRLLQLRPGTRIVSNSFGMGDWQPDQSTSVQGGCEHYCTALLWIVPARVGGNWRMGQQELRLTQKYQMLSGTLDAAPIVNGRLDGRRISFTANGVRYSGTIEGTTMQGTTSGGANWSATKL
ncbi:SAM-dependent methyltransferase [Bordetella genomosp. 9]|uniref:SAM-dependent methyltransferase n=1 Tax=Bordetella genomosp. 9 TaxID=1416803 RepID=UPI000A29111C|nr:class I SAM-dependent methyltransferase [Bordetella genomosp. 9]ARP89142.1 SAM-dependent methyltransferase [Bordetella genomosp. 9]